MATARNIRDVGAGSTTCDRRRRIGHLDLVNVVPEGSKVHIVVAAVIQQVPVDGIVRLSSRRGDTTASEVGPAVHVKRSARRDADGGVLGSERRHGVVHVVRVADLLDIRSPQVILSGLIDLRAVRNGSAAVRPGPGDGGSAVDGDLPAGRETEVRAIVTADERWVVGIGAGAAAGHGIGVAIYGRGPKGKKGKGECAAHDACTKKRMGKRRKGRIEESRRSQPDAKPMWTTSLFDDR